MKCLQRLRRVLRHLWADERDTRRALGVPALTRLQSRVHASEQRHSGEIRVCVEAALPMSYLWKDLSARDRALMMFSKLRVWDTAQNNGVLIYLLLAEHAIEIVADRGLSAHIGTAQWQALLGQMREAFRGGRFEEGLSDAIDVVDRLLLQHFPLAPGELNPNELPDAPHLR